MKNFTLEEYEKFIKSRLTEKDFIKWKENNTIFLDSMKKKIDEQEYNKEMIEQMANHILQELDYIKFPKKYWKRILSCAYGISK